MFSSVAGCGGGANVIMIRVPWWVDVSGPVRPIKGASVIIAAKTVH
jgi:hypothetical protein